jgi:5-methylcytosine-specific restriction endonuclease McrA
MGRAFVTWFMVDDGWPIHSKVRRAGPDGRSLWMTVGPLCAREDTDGFVDPFMLRDSWGALSGVKSWRSAAKKLVESGLWHDHVTIESCERCLSTTEPAGGLKEGWFYFHDWEDYQLKKDGKRDSIARKRNLRKKHLHQKEEGKRIKAAVITRDQGLCRYCGVYTSDNSNDHRSRNAREIDHVDPFDWVNSEENCVVACKVCNGRKKDRTPEEAGMVLLPVPSKNRSKTRSEPDLGSGIERENPSENPIPASRDARDGPGSGPDRVEIGSGSPGVGPVPVLAGSNGNGAGHA